MACKTFSRDFNSPSSVLISINLNCRVARKREIPCAFFPPEKISHATAFIIVGVHMPRSPDLAGSVHPRVEVLGRLERRQQEREWGVHISRAGISLSLSLSLSLITDFSRARASVIARIRGEAIRAAEALSASSSSAHRGRDSVAERPSERAAAIHPARQQQEQRSPSKERERKR